MKTTLITCLLGMGLGVAALSAQDEKKEEKKSVSAPDFTDPVKLTEKSPETFKAKFETTKGNFTVEVTRSLSPNGADRFYNLVRSGYFKDVAFFRVIPGFMCQFGIHGDPKISAAWGKKAQIPDDPVKGSNTRGTITFAQTRMPNSRSAQFFINFGDNSQLDGQRFAPFGKVIEGLEFLPNIRQNDELTSARVD